MTDGLKYVPYVPRGFEGPTTDVVDALKRGKAVLIEEDRWVKHSWFDNEHPEVDPQDPYCNSWQACAEGAVLVVTVGLHNYSTIRSPIGESVCPWRPYVDDRITNPLLYEAQDPFQRALYDQAVSLLGEVGYAIYKRETGSPEESVEGANHYNDSFFQTRDEVIAWFDETIEAAQPDWSAA